MSNNRINVQAGGFPAFALFLVFLVLKLTDTIDWSWFYVTMPLWLGFAIVACVTVIVFTCVGIKHYFF